PAVPPGPDELARAGLFGTAQPGRGPGARQPRDVDERLPRRGEDPSQAAPLPPRFRRGGGPARRRLPPPRGAPPGPLPASRRAPDRQAHETRGGGPGRVCSPREVVPSVVQRRALQQAGAPSAARRPPSDGVGGASPRRSPCLPGGPARPGGGESALLAPA